MRKTSLVVIIGLLASIVGFVPEAQATEARPVVVELGFETITDMVYVPEADRIVVVGDDQALIYTRDGQRTATIANLPGAISVDQNGQYAVVAAADTEELVVINVVTGVVDKRIAADAQDISSISVVGDTIWYAFGSNWSPEGLGKASISAGQATPEFMIVNHAGASIDVSSGMPDSVFYTPLHTTPADLHRVDPGEVPVDSPYHEMLRPIVVDEAGEFVYAYAYDSDQLVQMRTDTLERTGFVYDSSDLSFTNSFASTNSLAIHNDEIMAQGFERTALIYEMGTAAVQNQIEFAGEIYALDVTGEQLFVATRGTTVGGMATGPTWLTIVPLDYTHQLRSFYIWVEAYGNIETSERPTLSWDCSIWTSGSTTVAYGHYVEIQLDLREIDCEMELSSVPGAWNTSVYVVDDWVDSETASVTFSTGGFNEVISFVHDFPSVRNDADTFVTQQYLDLLDRAPTPIELSTDAQRVATGAVSPAGFVTELVEGQDFLGTVAPVSRLYLAYFGRWPDEPGLSYWLMRSRGGLTLDAASNYFASSPEFDTRYGDLTDNEFVQLVYRNVLGRDAEGAGFDYWTAQLRSGLSRGELMTGFSESPENIKSTETPITVRSLYHALLEREPDAEGFEYWSGVHQRGQSLEGMVVGFLESVEYYRRFWNTDPVAGLRTEIGEDTSEGPASQRPLEVLPEPALTTN